MTVSTHSDGRPTDKPSDIGQPSFEMLDCQNAFDTTVVVSTTSGHALRHASAAKPARFVQPEPGARPGVDARDRRSHLARPASCGD